MKYEHLLIIISKRKMKRLVFKYHEDIFAGLFLGITLGLWLNLH